MSNDEGDNSTTRTSPQTKFEEINQRVLVHKSNNVGNPAIIQHKAFWKPISMPDNEWHQEIFTFLKLSYNRVRGIAGKVAKFEPSNSYSRLVSTECPITQTSYRMRIRSSTCLISVIIDIFDEFWSIKTIIDFTNTSFRNLPGCAAASEISFHLFRLQAIFDLRRFPSGGDDVDFPLKKRASDIKSTGSTRQSSADLAGHKLHEKPSPESFQRPSKSAELSTSDVVNEDTQIELAHSTQPQDQYDWPWYINAFGTHLLLTKAEEKAILREFRRAPEPKHEFARYRLDSIIDKSSNSISRLLVAIENDLYPFDKLRNDFVNADAQANNVNQHEWFAGDVHLFASFVGFCFETRASEASPIPTKNKAESVRENILPENTIDNENGHDIIDALWPVIKGLNPYLVRECKDSSSSPKGPVLSREITISLINDGRALYATSLGGIRDAEGSSVYFPLSYILVTPHRAKWQIGRIIEKIHLLGIYRLAALSRYETIHKFNDRMRDLTNSLNKSSSVENIAKRFKNIRRTEADGILYEIEWSRLYAQLFKIIIRQLKFDKLKGYQSYPEFVGRRIDPKILIIDGVRQRFNYLSSQIQAEAELETTEKIRELLLVGEFASVFPIAYYSRESVEHINKFVVDLLGWHSRLSWQYAWMLIVTVYTAFILFRLYRGLLRLAKDHFNNGQSPKSLPPKAPAP